jgi:hypothetical protein
MKTKKPVAKKRYFTVPEANSTLPLARAIVQDIATLARDLRQRHERLSRLRPNDRIKLGAAYEEELQQVTAEFERDQERMAEYVKELTELGIELKDYDTGLVDFLCRLDDREVYLCWRLGEPEVSHWHELDGGFAGRREITEDFGSRKRAEATGLNN